MYDSNQTRQGGQTWTLDVRTDQKSGKTTVTCPAVPHLKVEESPQQYAVQQMKRLLDDYQANGYKEASENHPYIPGSGELLDDNG